MHLYTYFVSKMYKFTYFSCACCVYLLKSELKCSGIVSQSKHVWEYRMKKTPSKRDSQTLRRDNEIMLNALPTLRISAAQSYAHSKLLF